MKVIMFNSVYIYLDVHLFREEWVCSQPQYKTGTSFGVERPRNVVNRGWTNDNVIENCNCDVIAVQRSWILCIYNPRWVQVQPGQQDQMPRHQIPNLFVSVRRNYCIRPVSGVRLGCCETCQSNSGAKQPDWDCLKRRVPVRSQVIDMRF